MDNKTELLDQLNNALNNAEKAEKVRVLYTLLWETLELDKQSDNLKTMGEKINALAKEEQQAINTIAHIQGIMKEQQEAEETAVS